MKGSSSKNLKVKDIKQYIKDIDKEISQVDSSKSDQILLVATQSGVPKSVNLSTEDMTQQCFWISLLQGIISSKYGDELNEYINNTGDLLVDIKEIAKAGRDGQKLSVNKQIGDDMDLSPRLGEDIPLC